MAVVCTDVGQCKEVIKKDGFVVPPKDPTALAHAIKFYLENGNKRKEDAANFNRRIKDSYTEGAVIPYVHDFYSRVLKEK